MKAEEIEKGEYDFTMEKEGFCGKNHEYDRIFILRRTRVDETKQDSILRAMYLYKLKKMKSGLLLVMESTVLDVMKFYDFLISKVVTAGVHHIVSNGKEATKAWQSILSE